MNDALYFELKAPLSASDFPTTADAKAYLAKEYQLKVDDLLYFKFLVDLSDKNTYDYVPGYATIHDFGVVGTNGSTFTHAWVKVDQVDREAGFGVGYKAVHPIAKSAWQFARLQNPILAYGLPQPGTNGVKQTFKALAQSSLVKQALDMLNGPNGTMQRKNFGRKFIPEKSWIRLGAPEGHKKGGGARVARIAINDGWDQMAPGQDAFEYGQEYDYNLPDGRSAGVATFEPQIGGDENPLRQPLFSNNKERLLAPNDEHYMELPLGESFYPAPSVGYSRVAVRNLRRTDALGNQTVTRNATGHTVHEFYTAKDFPVRTSRTDMDDEPQRSDPFSQTLGFFVQNHMTVSQGFTVELNDMHGKPKGQSVYPETAAPMAEPISKIEYTYRTDAENRLDNTVDVLNQDGTTVQREVGVDFDFIADFRQEKSESSTFTLQGNLAAFMVAIAPGIVPTIIPSVAHSKSRFRSSVITKVVNRYGILEETRAFDRGSTVKTENLAWDSETGEVLVTETQNDFDDPVYSLTYPAHWGYDRMGAAYRNIGAQFATAATNNNGRITNPNNVLVKGDEVMCSPSAGAPFKAWVWDDDDAADNEVHLIYADGSGINNDTYNVKVIRSGRRNQQSAPMGTLTTLVNPLTNFPGNSFSKVLEANAIQYSEEWQMEAGYQELQNNGACNCNSTPEAAAFQNLLNGLAGNGQLVSPASTALNSYPSFSTLNATGGTANYTTAAEQFVKKYSGSTWGHIVGLMSADDCGYYMLSYDAGFNRAMLLKLDANGNLEWSHGYDNICAPGDEKHLSFAKNQQNEIAIAATDGNGVHVITVDVANGANGNLIGEATLKNNVSSPIQYDYFSSQIIYVPQDYGHNAGFAVIGGVENTQIFWVTKLDNGLSETWSHEININRAETFDYDIDVVPTVSGAADNGFIISQGSSNFFNSVGDVSLLHLSPSGTINWDHTYSKAGISDLIRHTEVEALPGSAGGGYITASEYKTFNDHFLMARINSTGNQVLWAKEFAVPGYEKMRQLIDNGDGTYLMVMGNNSGLGLMAVKADQNGNLLWAKRFETNVDGYSVDVAPNACASGYVLGGFVPQTSELAVVRTDLNGTGAGCTENSLYLNPFAINLLPQGTLLGADHRYFTNTPLNQPGAAGTVMTSSIADICCDGNDLIGKVAYPATPASDCQFTLYAPGSNFCFSNITGFSNLVPAAPGLGCGPIYDFTVTATLATGSTVTISGTNNCWVFNNCVGSGTQIVNQCGKVPGDVVNPYVTGLRGNWRPKASYLYLTERYRDPSQFGSTENTNLRDDGYYTSFSPYWTSTNGGEWAASGLSDPKWTFTSEVSCFHPDGAEVENRDALGRYSAAQYGYANTLPVAVGSNVSYRSIGFDGFEDYDYIPDGTCDRQHFNFFHEKSNVIASEAHSGRHCLQVAPSGSAIMERELELNPNCNSGADQVPYAIKGCDPVGIFSPELDASTERQFVVSYWTRSLNSTLNPGMTDFPDQSVDIRINGVTLSKQRVKKSPIIDGWQWHEFVVRLPAAANVSSPALLEVVLKSQSGVHLFDDLRMHPFDANIKSYVYDPISLRLMAELDANNYATFYEYDEAGQLIRVKKETERGIMTIQETRNHTAN